MSDCDSCCRPRLAQPCEPCLGSVTNGSVTVGSDSFPSSYVALMWFDDQSVLIEWNSTPSEWQGSFSYDGCTYDLTMTVVGPAKEDVVLEVTDGSATWTFKNHIPIADTLQSMSLLFYSRSGTSSCGIADPANQKSCICLLPGFDEVSGCSAGLLAPVCVDDYTPYRIYRPLTWQLTTSGFAGKIRVTEDGAFFPPRWADYYFDNLTSDFNKVWSPLSSAVTGFQTKCNDDADGYTFCNYELGLFEQYKQTGYVGTVSSPGLWNFRYQWGEGVSGNCWVQAVLTVKIVPQARSSNFWFPEWQFVWTGDVIYITDGVSTTEEFEMSLLNAFSQSVASGTLCFSGVNSSWAGREIVDLSEFTMGELAWEPY